MIQEKGVRSSCDVLTKAQLICPFGLFFCWTGFISSSLSSVTVPNTTGSFQSRITRRFPQDDVTITLSLQFPWEQRRRAEACDAAPVPVIALREFCGMWMSERKLRFLNAAHVWWPQVTSLLLCYPPSSSYPQKCTADIHIFCFLFVFFSLHDKCRSVWNSELRFS